MRRRLPALLRDTRGVSAVEFALVAPVAILLMFGEFMLCDAATAKRKLTIAAHTLADLVARQSSVSASSLASFTSACAEIIAPYSAASMSIVIAELSTDGSGHTTVTWSAALNGTPLTQGAAFAPPAGVAQANTSLIYSNVAYQYTPAFGQGPFGTMTLQSQFYMNPRVTATVAYQN
jgi:Flp pilus assembly protein TadG